MVLAIAGVSCTSPNNLIRHFDRLELTRSICFGACPEYRIVIDGDGLVEYWGGRDVEMSGRRTARIGRAEVQHLIDALNAVQFLAFRSRYAQRDDGCPRVGTDQPTVTIRLELGGSVKEVRHYHGCFTLGSTLSYPYPVALTALENRIDELAGTFAWVGRRQRNVPLLLVFPGRGEW